MHITLRSSIESTSRVRQVRGLFDLPESAGRDISWQAELPITERDWNIGLITGPSGCGKSTVARHVFAQSVWPEMLGDWPSTMAVIDGFPDTMSIRDVTALLGSVGLNSPPAWLRPYTSLSTGERFRCDLARLLARLETSALSEPRASASGQGNPSLTAGAPRKSLIGVFDEFTSVVDRTVARVGSAALAKAVRQRNLRFVAVTCHDDVIEWLQPDWVFRPDLAIRSEAAYAEPAFAWRSLRRRPSIEIELVRCHSSAWPLFAPHHYLSGALNRSSICFLASHAGTPVGFSAWLNRLSARGGKREHRTVVLPDWQGVGLGMAISSIIASMWKGLGKPATSTTSHPGLIAARRRSMAWRMIRRPSLASIGRRDAKFSHATTRLTAGFEYIGPVMTRLDAVALLSDFM